MVNMKCELCGAVWTKTDSYKGMETRCPNCQGRCKCLSDSESELGQSECMECGLVCSAGTKKCPACGGKVVVGRKHQEEDGSTLDQDFLKSWEKNLGGYSFSVIVSLAISVIVSVFSISSIPWAEIKSSVFLWLVRIEMVVSSALSIFAVSLLCLFFRRSRHLFRWLPSYFKIRGFVVVIDFIALILFDEMMSTGHLAQINIKSVITSAFWSFFWAWYFKRAFRMNA